MRIRAIMAWSLSLLSRRAKPPCRRRWKSHQLHLTTAPLICPTASTLLRCRLPPTILRLRLLRTGGRPAPLSPPTMEKIPILATTALATPTPRTRSTLIIRPLRCRAPPTILRLRLLRTGGRPAPLSPPTMEKIPNLATTALANPTPRTRYTLIIRPLRCRAPPTIVRLRLLRTGGRPAPLSPPTMEKIPTLATTALANPTPRTRYPLIIRPLRCRAPPTIVRLRLLRTGGRPAPLSPPTMEKIPILATTALANPTPRTRYTSDHSSPALPSAANDSASQAAQDRGPPGAALVGDHGKDSNSGHDGIGESHAGNKIHSDHRLQRCRALPTIVRLRLLLRTRGRPALLPSASMEKIPTLATTASANPTLGTRHSLISRLLRWRPPPTIVAPQAAQDPGPPGATPAATMEKIPTLAMTASANPPPGTRHSLIIRLLRWRPLPTMSHLRLIRTRGRPAALPSATLEKINSRSIPILATTANLPPGTPHSLTSRPLR